ncbi:S8 family peptidase, partial [candidate division TA06 bacterium]|nr:S8 family peptidase [candidate division TA06 bacterium]
AHVMTFSIGWSHAWGPDRTSWRNALDNALLAGLHASVAAGNEDNFYSPPDNVRTPGDVPPPWLHPDQTLSGGLSGVVTVGATNSGDTIAGFSSRGPVSWEIISPWFDYPYNPEMGLIDPDVSAPGVCVTSLNAFNNTSYVSCWNGTSMATPHVAGLMALMLSKNPSLSPALVDSIIEVTAIELGLPGKDNAYGSGRINALAAINAVPASNSPNLQMIDYTLIDTLVGDGDGRPESNETVELVVTLENQIGVQDASLVQGTLSTNDTTLTLIDSTASFPDIPSGTSADNGGNPFLFTVAPGVVPHWATLILEITAEPNSFSTTDSFTIRVGRPEILLVDDDEGALYEDYYIAPLESLQIYYDQWNILSSGLPGTELTQYSCVIWFTGDDDTTTLTLQDESDLTDFLDGGGNLFISGQNIGEDIGGVSTFYASYLRSTFLQGNANDNLLLGVPGDEIGAGLNLVIQGVNGAGNADSEDKIAPLSGANAVFTYNTALGTSALKYDSGIFRVVYFAFPFEAIHGAGAFASRDTVMARVLGWLCASAVGVEEEERESRAKSQTLTLFQNQPNPFHHTTTIQYQIPMKNAVRLAIYDLSGRLVETLVDNSQEPGVYQVQWEGRDQASGIYFYRLSFGKELAIRKMTLLR